MDCIHYQDSGSENSCPVICLHGFLGRGDDFDFADSLTEHLRLIKIDLPGHGQSQCEEDELYRMERTALMIVSLIAQLGLHKPHVIGYSMGGRLALYLAVHYADKFGRFVLESTSPGLKTEEERAARVEHDETLAKHLESEPLEKFLDDWFAQPLFDGTTADADKQALLKQKRLENDPTGLARSLRNMGTGRQPSLWENLPRIEADLLLIAGAQDYKFLKINREMAARCPRASLRVVKGAGHNVHWEYPEDYLALVRDFLISRQG
ncbi:MAG TPA: 2-succinyl-6-hydroxy-2,4-cyclohexadiene-1-carboxylate synthase [candidate division Zixibacteria bacterium]|nr:2-succinyl-6-hydroxy-2,4-cyclohexadiene-1-carboxylate synthase [candidate division Zixibacteria bacterium]